AGGAPTKGDNRSAARRYRGFMSASSRLAASQRRARGPGSPLNDFWLLTLGLGAEPPTALARISVLGGWLGIVRLPCQLSGGRCRTGRLVLHQLDCVLCVLLGEGSHRCSGGARRRAGPGSSELGAGRWW